MSKWWLYPKSKPKKSRCFLCTCTDPVKTVEKLFYDAENDEWIDISRAEVFSRFEVMKKVNDPNLHKEYYELMNYDEKCIRKDVSAYKFLPEPYGLK